MTRHDMVVKFAFDNLNDIQRSGSGTAFDHGLRVAEYIKNELGINEEVIYKIALLHDVLEDTDVEKEVMLHVFGYEIVEGIEFLTRKNKRPDDDQLALKTRIDENLEVFDAPYHIRLVKCADRIDNLDSSLNLKPADKKFHRVPYWVVETKYSLYSLARMTDDRAYKDLVRLNEELAKMFPQEVIDIEERYLICRNK